MLENKKKTYLIQKVNIQKKKTILKSEPYFVVTKVNHEEKVKRIDLAVYKNECFFFLFFYIKGKLQN